MQGIINITTIIMLVKISYIDYKLKIIPNKLSICVAVLGIFNLIINYDNCKIYIASAAITFAVFLFLAIITDGGIGGGDIKLFTALGLVLGHEIMLVITVTFVVAAIITIPKFLLKRIKTKESIALAPYICAGTIICLIKIYIF